LPFGLPRKRHYNTKEVAKVLGISADLLRWRIKTGKYPDARRGNAGRRLFSVEDVVALNAAGGVRDTK
jgi:DNA-binding transcriptional MerR regulator